MGVVMCADKKANFTLMLDNWFDFKRIKERESSNQREED